MALGVVTVIKAANTEVVFVCQGQFIGMESSQSLHSPMVWMPVKPISERELKSRGLSKYSGSG